MSHQPAWNALLLPTKVFFYWAEKLEGKLWMHCRLQGWRKQIKAAFWEHLSLLPALISTGAWGQQLISHSSGCALLTLAGWLRELPQGLLHVETLVFFWLRGWHGAFA
jgi:hypothetical protein